MITDLENVVDQLIYRHPSLYRSKDRATSRLNVCENLFLCIGTGFEWHPDGYLYQTICYDKECDECVKIPDNYYDSDLYYFYLKDEGAKEFEEGIRQKIGNRFNYENDRFLYFNFTDEEAEEFRETCDYKYFIHKIENHFSPYGICEFSALSEIMNGRTNSPNMDNFDFTPKEDWLQGCKEVAVRTWEYYHDEKQFSNNHYYPTKTINHIRYDLEDGDKYNRERLIKNMEGKTVEEFCQSIWDRHLAEQLDYLTKFFDKFEIKV